MAIKQVNMKALDTNIELEKWRNTEFSTGSIPTAKRIDKVLRRRYLTLGKIPMMKFSMFSMFMYQ